MIMEKIKCITDLAPEDISSRVVLKCIDEESRNTILIKSSSVKSSKNTDNTNDLILITDMELAIVGREKEKYLFHSLTCKNKDPESERAFETAFNFLKEKCLTPLSKIEASELFESLKQLFKTEIEKTNEKLQIGVFGELLAIWRLHQLGVDGIYKKYHRDFFLKHDIELNDKNRIEVKSTTGQNRVHTFRHDQIYRTDCFVAVISIILERAQEGTTLYQMFQVVEADIKDPSLILYLEESRKNCGVNEENPGISFALDDAIDNIGFYWAKDLPRFESPEPSGVTNTQYDVDLSRSLKVEEKVFIEWCNKIIEEK
jgi:hypothetical protein